MIELSSKQRKLLEKYANSIDPVVIVGGNGVSAGVTEKVLQSLECHELIKVKFNEFKDEKYELTQGLVESCQATLVRIIGNVAILYKACEERENRRYEKELSKLA
ncbi:MAG: YhbY family RNA-binding protein [Treponema sp.]|nr:YhbY family RNA-binding protein [Treponema sp.]